MRQFPVRIHATDKLTNRTCLIVGSIVILTGSKYLVRPGYSGYTEYNERGEPVLDSWVSIYDNQSLYKLV